jgi:hypothetical protein
MTNASFTLTSTQTKETLTFRPDGNAGNVVYVDHRFPNGMPGYCYQPGVGRMNQRMSLTEARRRWSDAIKAGWVRAQDEAGDSQKGTTCRN